MILPINGAQFLPGAHFDVRVEVHAEEMPEDFAVTINGTDASEVTGVEPTPESWTFGDEEDPTPSSSHIWRDVSISEPGMYTVTVTAGGSEQTVHWHVRAPAESAGAKNVILFIVDGGSTAVYTAARLISRGMEQGTYHSNLSFEDFEEIGFLHTSGMDSIITDSANSASAYNTGHKTAVNANGVYPDTSADKFDDPRVAKFGYLVKEHLDMSVGIVTDSHWADATPNGVYGFGRDRSNEALNMYITQPLDEGLLPEVILGGGARNMIPQSVDGSRREDDRDLFTEYEEAGYTVVTTASELTAAVPVMDSHEMTETEGMTDTMEMTDAAELPSRVLGIFNTNHLNVWLDRHVYTENLGDMTDQPDLDVMTMAAIEILSQNENGFYLEVEAASVDKALHPMDFDRALADMISMDRAIAAAVDWAEEHAPETLIIVTSDHAHSYDVYGTVDTEVFNAAEDDAGKRAAIGIYSGAGFPTYEDADGDYYPDSWEPTIGLAQGKVENPVFTEDFQVSPVYRTPSIRDEDRNTIDNPDDDPNGLPLGGNLPEGSTSSVHTLQSVPVYSHGPGSNCLGRVVENTEVFFCMAAAVGLNPATGE